MKLLSTLLLASTVSSSPTTQAPATTTPLACQSGYELKGNTCEDINECHTSLNTCAQKCNNDPGSFTCSCDAEYKLNSDGFRNICDDIDECDVGTYQCDSGKVCNNIDGGYECVEAPTTQAPAGTAATAGTAGTAATAVGTASGGSTASQTAQPATANSAAATQKPTDAATKKAAEATQPEATTVATTQPTVTTSDARIAFFTVMLASIFCF